MLQPELTSNEVIADQGIIHNTEILHANLQRERNLRISCNLQVHLEINNLIQVFANMLKEYIDYDHLSYQNPSLDMQINIGEVQRHLLNYGLSIEGEYLGALQITREHLFSDKEIAEIEEIMCSLVYPLRNGIRYYQAIKDSNQDPLTAVANRSGLPEALHREWELAQRHNYNLSLLIIDIDHFKTINDTFGHICGDMILVQVAEHIKNCVRESDLVFRYGGDEFLVVLRETNESGAIILAERIRQIVEKSIYQHKNKNINITTSIGISCNYHKGISNETELLEHTDQALYRAKNEGRNLVSL